MAFRSPAPHRRSSGNIGNKLTKGGKPNKYTPHASKKQQDKRLREITQAQHDDEERFPR